MLTKSLAGYFATSDVFVETYNFAFTFMHTRVYFVLQRCKGCRYGSTWLSYRLTQHESLHFLIFDEHHANHRRVQEFIG